MQVKEIKFGKILQNARRRKGITQDELSKMTGFTSRMISYWETGKKDITFEHADKVAKALGITVTIGKE